MNKLQEHPNILNSIHSNPDGIMKHAGKSESVMYNILELAENGPLSSYIRVTGSIEEELVRFMFLQLSDAVRHMHTKLLAHLDLKLENILLDKYYNIKLADLGVAHQLTKDDNRCCHRRGTIYYMAPEVTDLPRDGEYDAYKADIYSLGVCLYILLIGDFPDQHILNMNSISTNESETEVGADVEMEKDNQSFKKWSFLSDEVKELLIGMLSFNPLMRPSIEDIVKSDWLAKPFYEEVQHNLYSEMIYRKNYISAFPRRKTKPF